jgi:hypothetical protein
VPPIVQTFVSLKQFLPLRFSASTGRKRHASFEIRVWSGVRSTIELRKASFSSREDSVVKAPVAAVVQSKTSSRCVLLIPAIYSDQAPSKVFDQELFAHATVKQVAKVLQVVLEGNEQPSHTVHNTQDLNACRKHDVKHACRERWEQKASGTDTRRRTITLIGCKWVSDKRRWSDVSTKVQEEYVGASNWKVSIDLVFGLRKV